MKVVDEAVCLYYTLKTVQKLFVLLQKYEIFLILSKKRAAPKYIRATHYYFNGRGRCE